MSTATTVAEAEQVHDPARVREGATRFLPRVNPVTKLAAAILVTTPLLFTVDWVSAAIARPVSAAGLHGLPDVTSARTSPGRVTGGVGLACSVAGMGRPEFAGGQRSRVWMACAASSGSSRRLKPR